MDMRDVNIIHGSGAPLVSPQCIKTEIPVWQNLARQVRRSRKSIEHILDGTDRRMLAIVGPCSIHDKAGTLAYADRLTRVAREVAEQLLVVMRLYFAKPRTTVGWRGLFEDPDLTQNGGDVNKGARLMRDIAYGVAHRGLPLATELLDPYMIRYIDDLVSYTCIGARTIESPLHRALASAQSSPVGLKNATHGDTKSAIDALSSVGASQGFWSMEDNGSVVFLRSTGNPYAHLILRGSDHGTNYNRASVTKVLARLKKRHLRESIVVDCSHGNSQKRSENQCVVLEDILRQRLSGTTALVGFMLESNLVAGRQDIPTEGSALTFGQSITDACIGFEETEQLLRHAADTLRFHC